jgi:hypothetical protein
MELIKKQVKDVFSVLFLAFVFSLIMIYTGIHIVCLVAYCVILLGIGFAKGLFRKGAAYEYRSLR